MLNEGLSIDTTFNPPQFSSDYTFNVRYHTGGSMKLNARILHLAHMVYL